MRKRLIPMKNGFLFWLLLGLLLGLAACHPAALETGSAGLGKSYEDEIRELGGVVKPGQSIAVSAFYDGDSGDFTALGDQWRDRAESALAAAGGRVMALRDMGLILDALEVCDPDFDEGEIWRQSGSDYLLAARYYLYENQGSPPADYLELKINLLKTADRTLAGSINWRCRLEPGWQGRAARVRGNIHHKWIEAIGPNEKKRPGPPLKAELDRNPPCYPTGAEVKLKISTGAGAYLYILNIAADNTVTLNCPNRYLPEKALPSGDFIFPPADLANLKLLVYPLPGKVSGREAFKVIASEKPLDFSFLKVPEGRIFAGAEAGELKKVLKVLSAAEGWSEVTLPYRVGLGCD